jgi:hypothetical protein
MKSQEPTRWLDPHTVRELFREHILDLKSKGIRVEFEDPEAFDQVYRSFLRRNNIEIKESFNQPLEGLEALNLKG